MEANPELYSVKDVSRIFDLQESRLRYWAQTGFVGPSVRRSNRMYYTFLDLIGVRVAKELLDGGLSLQRVRKNLEALQGLLPAMDRPLARLRVYSDGEKCVVKDEGTTFEPETGQIVMQFEVDDLSQRVARVLSAAPPDIDDSPEVGPAHELDSTLDEASPFLLFQAGVAAEEAGDLPRAESLYRRVLDGDPRFSAAWTNLGNLLEGRGARGEAREAYEQALEADPDQPEARYNLANLLSDVGEDALATVEYRRVLAVAPEFADAHYNLGLIYLRQGARHQARAHLEEYLCLDEESPWAREARTLLEVTATAESAVADT